MFDVLVSRVALRAVSAMLGGFGMFSLYLSFRVPALGGQAVVLLGAASAIVHFCKA